LVRLLQSTLKTPIRHLMDTLVRICTASMPRTSRSPCKRCLSVSVAALARVLSRPVSLGSRKRRGDSEWAFGLNRRISSVCSVAVNFGFHRSTTDRFAIESKTDEFGVGFVGSVFRFHRTNRGEHRGTNQQRERRTGEEQIDKERSQMPHAPLPASAKSCSALSASSSKLSDSPPRCRRPPRRCSRRHRFA